MERVKRLIKVELNQTHKNWKGTAVPLIEGLSVFGTNQLLRSEVNKVGRIHGCHQCLTVLATDTDQPWIGDHIPPTELSSRVREAYGLPDTTRLLPSCWSCSSKQAAFVKSLNATPTDELQDWDGDEVLNMHRMIHGGETTRPVIPSHGPKVNATQGLQVQANGTIDGCHICEGKVPCDVYIADHCPPQEFLTSWMPQLCDALGVTIPDPAARPHCPRCSGNQGGKMSGLVKRAKQLARDLGITVYS